MFPKINQFTCDKRFITSEQMVYIFEKPAQIQPYLQTQVCILKTPKNLKSKPISGQKHILSSPRLTKKTISFPILQCRVGSMVSSAFFNVNTHLSEIFDFNISESQTYSKYYHYQANISNASPRFTCLQICLLALVFKRASLCN